MDDTISRRAAIQALCKAVHKNDNTIPCDNQTVSCLWSKTRVCDFAREIYRLPPAQPERKKGKWVDEKINSYTSRTYCSECGNSAPFICVSGDHYGRNMHGETEKTKFCPNCGADMREENDNGRFN